MHRQINNVTIPINNQAPTRTKKVFKKEKLKNQVEKNSPMAITQNKYINK